MLRIPANTPYVNDIAAPQAVRDRTGTAIALGLSVLGNKSRILVTPGANKRLKRMSRLVQGASGQIQRMTERSGRRWYAAMITLTYAPGHAYEPRHISQFLNRCRDWCRRRKIRLHAVWVAELQQRGAVHYHLLIWLPNRHLMPKPDQAGWWPHGSSEIATARSPVRYLAKYTSKIRTKSAEIPKGCRIYGICGCPVHLGWWRAPYWMRCIGSPGQRIGRRRGGWWAVEEMAWAWRSPWTVVHIGPEGVEIEWVGWRPTDIRPLWSVERDQKIRAKEKAAQRY